MGGYVLQIFTQIVVIPDWHPILGARPSRRFETPEDFMGPVRDRLKEVNACE